MKYEIRMKTGFFATKRYYLSALSGGIFLSPADDLHLDSILVPEDDLLGIMLIKEKRSAIEIKTSDRVITGVFDSNLDLRDVHSELRKQIKKDVIYVEM